MDAALSQAEIKNFDLELQKRLYEQVSLLPTFPLYLLDQLVRAVEYTDWISADE